MDDEEYFCHHEHDENCYDEDRDRWDCQHQHCFNCGECGCPGYCDDYQTYNLRGLDESTGTLVDDGNH